MNSQKARNRIVLAFVAFALFATLHLWKYGEYNDFVGATVSITGLLFGYWDFGGSNE